MRIDLIQVGSTKLFHQDPQVSEYRLLCQAPGHRAVSWLHSNNNHQEQVTCHTDASSPKQPNELIMPPTASSTFCLDDALHMSTSAEHSVKKRPEYVDVIDSHRFTWNPSAWPCFTMTLVIIKKMKTTVKLLTTSF